MAIEWARGDENVPEAEKGHLLLAAIYPSSSVLAAVGLAVAIFAVQLNGASGLAGGSQPPLLDSW